MRQTFILLTSFVLLLSCNNTNTTKVLSESTTTRRHSDTVKTKTQRQILVDELRQLQAVIASNNKEKIADLFSFPVSDEAVGIYIDDSTFNAQLDKNGHKVTRAMFLRSYHDVSESLQIEQVNQLFEHIDVNRLLEKDTIKYEAIIKTEPCYRYYKVQIKKELVTLTMGTNSNQDYQSKSDPEDELPENDSAICEHMLWWTFTFDGKQLHLKEISGAD